MRLKYSMNSLQIAKREYCKWVSMHMENPCNWKRCAFLQLLNLMKKFFKCGKLKEGAFVMYMFILVWFNLLVGLYSKVSKGLNKVQIILLIVFHLDPSTLPLKKHFYIKEHKKKSCFFPPPHIPTIVQFDYITTT
jgi:hypothetical protein